MVSCGRGRPAGCQVRASSASARLTRSAWLAQRKRDNVDLAGNFVGLGPEDDLAVGVAAFELGVGLADLRQRVDVRDRHLEVSAGDQAGQLGQHLGARPGLRPPPVFTPCFWAAA